MLRVRVGEGREGEGNERTNQGMNEEYERDRQTRAEAGDWGKEERNENFF